ncbi:hypothetical protein [Halobacteriovorax sp. DA5]|uniref:hypothetical protein n=1 Tax=Halobacteriovorax sp. DA5 TaxID=2067553 RepID=UPI000CD08BE9|nr:hypothetical protein [Halobacteriovorax sp. DA5]POB13340.1 hypothetical protein C0Z22_09255 [Halobacteriovorax sp. DA5]
MLKFTLYSKSILMILILLSSTSSYSRRVKPTYSWSVLILKLRRDFMNCAKPVVIDNRKLRSGCGKEYLQDFDLDTYKKFTLTISDRDILIFNYEGLKDFNGELIHYRYMEKDIVRVFRSVYPLEIYEYCNYKKLNCEKLEIENRYPKLTDEKIEKLLNNEKYIAIPTKYYSTSEDSVVFSFFRNDLGYHDFKYVKLNKGNKAKTFEVMFSSQDKFEIIKYCLNKDTCNKIEALRQYIQKFESYI